MTPAGREALRVGLVTEQLRRPVPGGIGTYARALVRALSELPGGPRNVGIEATEIRSRPLVGGDPPGPLDRRGPKMPSVLVTRLWDRGLLPVDGYDLVHATSMALPPSPRPRTAMVHDLAWRRFPEAYPERGRAWHEAALRRIGSSAAAVCVPSEKVAGELLGAGVDLTPDRVAVIPEGSDHLPEADGEAAGDLLSRLGVTGDFLLSVSTLEPRKNLTRLAEAYEAARRELPEPWPLVVVGPAGWGESFEASPGVLPAGRLSDAVLAGLYGRARALCYVPLDEGFGLPVAEAMAAGIPVLASRGVPAAEGAALVVDAGDTEAMAAGIVSVATDESERRRLVDLGRSVAAEHTWARAARAHAEWWHEVAGA